MRYHVVFAALALCGSTYALASASPLDPLSGEDATQAAPNEFSSGNLLSESQENVIQSDPPRQVEASLELRRLAEIKPRATSRPKGVFSLLSSLGLLAHAGYQARKTWNTIPFKAPYVTLGIGKARFDTTNLGIYSLFAGLLLFYIGLKRRWASHKQRKRERADSLIVQDQIRKEYLKSIGK